MCKNCPRPQPSKPPIKTLILAILLISIAVHFPQIPAMENQEYQQDEEIMLRISITNNTPYDMYVENVIVNFDKEEFQRKLRQAFDRYYHQRKRRTKGQ